MVGPGHYKWYQSRSPTPMWGSVPFGPQSHGTQRGRCVCMGGGGGGVGGGCLSHSTSDRGKTSWQYISMGSSQPSRCVLKP